MRFSAPLIPARFLERRQRFLALVELPDQRRVWVHVPNSGALTGCLDPGQEILLTHDERPGRKTAYTWRFVRGAAGWICIDTLGPNRLVAEALAAGGLPGLPVPSRVRAEVTIPQGSRLDFVLEVEGKLLFIEVKSVTWVEDGIAENYKAGITGTCGLFFGRYGGKFTFFYHLPPGEVVQEVDGPGEPRPPQKGSLHRGSPIHFLTPRPLLCKCDLIRREAKMSNPEPTKEDLEAPAKAGWWRRFWGG